MVLQGSDEERNVIVGNVEFHSVVMSTDFPAATACLTLAAAGIYEALALNRVGAFSPFGKNIHAALR